MAVDPVCGMPVGEKEATLKTAYKGRIYYFCAPGCKVAFEKDPTRYAGNPENESSRVER